MAECPDVDLNSKEDQEAIKKLTQVEVIHNEKLSSVHFIWQLPLFAWLLL